MFKIEHKNIIYIPGNSDMVFKRKFINTCDALIHARVSGETFGLTCGEFAICNKPIITFGLSKSKNHLDILKDKCLIFNNYNDIYDILKNDKIKNLNYFHFTRYLLALNNFSFSF